MDLEEQQHWEEEETALHKNQVPDNNKIKINYNNK